MTTDGASVSLFDRTFEEALDLLVEARDYIAARDDPEAGQRRALVQLVVSCETMRLTARLTQIMAWLLVQRAVHAGELTPAEAAQPERRLGGREVCAAHDCWGDVPLPPRLQDLLDRSLGLYRRIARLDEMASLRASDGHLGDRRLGAPTPQER